MPRRIRWQSWLAVVGISPAFFQNSATSVAHHMCNSLSVFAHTPYRTLPLFTVSSGPQVEVNLLPMLEAALPHKDLS